MSSTSALTINSRIKLSDGNSIPQFGLGTWRSDKGLVEAAVAEAIKVGYRHIDCAWIYGNESEVGRGIVTGLESTGINRSELFITTKIWNNHHDRADVIESIDESLKHLQLSYIDLVLIHWPTHWLRLDDRTDTDSKQLINEKVQRIFNTNITMKSVWQALESLVDSGKIKSIGISNFNYSEVSEIMSIARIKPVTNQIELHPYFNQSEYSARLMREYGITTTSYCPLGNLKRETGDHAGLTPLNDPIILAAAQQYNRTPAQIIIRWHLQSGMIVIPKSVTLARIKENSQVFDFELSAETMIAINSLGSNNVRFVNPDFRENFTNIF